MKILLIGFLILSLCACGPAGKGTIMITDTNEQGHTTQTKIKLKGNGFITKDKVVLSKTFSVNNAVGGCTRLSAASCKPQHIRYDSAFLRAYRGGHTISEAKIKSDVISSLQYGQSRTLSFPMNAGIIRDKCFFIESPKGGFVPVRNGSGLGAFLFSNPLLPIGNEERIYKQQLTNAQQELRTAEKMLASSQDFLSTSPAYRKGRCVTLKRERLPPKPRVMSQSRASFQAGGTCVDLYASRHSVFDVRNALGAIQRRDLIKTHLKWLRTNPPSCTRLNISQIESFICDAHKIFGKHAYRSCIQDRIAECMQTVMSQCRGGIYEWEQEVKAIKAEPKRKRQECALALATKKKAKREIPPLQANVQTIQDEKSLPPASNLPLFVDLQDAVCY